MPECIERDFLISKLMVHLRKYPNACYSASEIILILNNVPTADVVEVKHGEWKQCFEDWRKQIEGDECSACGFQHYGTSISNYNYCPNCGAKMDLKEGENNG